jgi:hypothetical protein
MNLCHVRKLGSTASAALLGAWLVLLGCGQQTLAPGDEAACRSDADCGSEQFCKPIPSPGQETQVVPPCMTTFSYCTSSADCPDGNVCWPQGRWSTPIPGNCFPTGRLCGPACEVSNLCLTDEVCEASGECRLPTCNEADATACPDRWRCDPGAAETEAMQPVAGANEADSSSYGRDILRGCARIRCDASGGFTCKDGWACDPDNATDPSGCIALSCAETGHCSDDARYICEPTSSASRPVGSDAHGCVLKNCEEGFVCQRVVDGIDVGYCDFDGPLVDAFGCAWLRCDEPGSTCNASQICEPGSSRADARGCRAATCEEGASCGSLPCDPSHPNADSRGCLPTTSTGAGGTGGSSGSTGGRAGAGGSEHNAQGGSSSAGTTGSGGSGAGASGAPGSAGAAPSAVTGRCVDR